MDRLAVKYEEGPWKRREAHPWWLAKPRKRRRRELVS